MKKVAATLIALAATASSSFGQTTFTVSGTPIPISVLKQNYGSLPKRIGAYDLSICNATATKQSIVSSELYQALAKADNSVLPLGRQIMLGVILSRQSRSTLSILRVTLNSATGVLSILGSSRYGASRGFTTAGAIGSVALQQIFADFKPLLTADQVEKFEGEVLEPALVLDSGSCVERTVFTLTVAPEQTSSKGLSFHVR